MSYLQDKKRKNKIITIATAVVIILLIIFFHTGLAHAGKAIIQTVIRPFLSINMFIRDRFSDAIISRYSQRTLANKIITLETELEAIQEKLVLYNTLDFENTELRKIVDIDFNKTDTIVAGVLRSPVVSHDTLLIDKGVSDGVVKTNSVLKGDTITLGTVSEVFPNTSIVKLHSFSGEKTEVVALGSNLSFEIVGRGGGNFEVIMPKDFVLESGTPLVLPGSSHLLVGIVGEKISDDHDPFTKYLIYSAVNPNNIRFVLIGKE